MSKRKKRLFILFSLVFVVTLLTIFGLKFGKAKIITEDNVKLQEDSELKYFLEISYDGKDSKVVSSSDSATAEVYSDYIYVEDTLPFGLTFENFIGTSNGSIGAVKRSDGTPCSGFVVDGTDGLKYDTSTRKITFKVKDLQAGCKLTVGMVTRTPSLSYYGFNRMDFYNTGYAREKSFTTKSTVHAYIERDPVTTYNVNYEYTGEVPDEAPNPPISVSYSAGSIVILEPKPVVSGYVFNGWVTEDADSNGFSFRMPSNDVTLKGSFTKIEKHKVTYIIDGDKPSNYQVPSEKQYAPGEIVHIDSTEDNTKYGVYKFLGWNIEDSSISLKNKEFTMPDKDVVIKGTFEKDSYNVTYEFIGETKPVNSSAILPKAKKYSVGAKVTVADRPSDTTCNNNKDCSFTEWSENDFKMPEEDVTIYGEWVTENRKFEPVITKEIVDKKESYKAGEEVNFKITVKNTSNIAITNVMLNEKLQGVTFIPGNGYTVKNSNNIVIDRIGPNESFVVSAKYIAGNDIYKLYENRVELLAALGTDDVVLNTDKSYIASTSFIVSNPVPVKPVYGNLNITKIDNNGKEIDGAEFTIYKDSNLKSIISTGLKFDNLLPGTYYLSETKVPDGYIGLKKVLMVLVSRDGSVTIPGYKVSNSNGLYNVRIVNNIPNIPPPTTTVNNPVYADLIVNKIDNYGNKVTGAEFTLYSDTGLSKIVGKGNAFKKLSANNTYFMKETKVPEGYINNNTLYEIIVDGNGNITIPGYEVINSNNVGTIEVVNDKIETTTVIFEEEQKEEPKVEVKEEKKEKNLPIIPLVAGIGAGFIFIILLFKTKRRVVMLYAPGIDINSIDYIDQLDYDEIYNHKVRVLILSDGNSEYINGNVGYKDTCIYEFANKKFKKVKEFKDEVFDEDRLLSEYMNYVYENYNSKKYDLVFTSKNNINIINSIENSKFKNKKLDCILYRNNNNINEELLMKLRQYANAIGYLSKDDIEYQVYDYIKVINYLYNKDSVEDVGKKYVNKYEELIQRIKDINSTQYISYSPYIVINLKNMEEIK